MDEIRAELVRRDQELVTAGAKLKAMDEQQRDSQRHIRLLKDSLAAKDEHYNLLLADVDELRRNLDERNKLLEKRAHQHQLGRFGAAPAGPQDSQQQQQQQQELLELQSFLEARDKRIHELQRKLVHLDNLLAERDSQLQRARLRFDAGRCGGGAEASLLGQLEETLADKDKQVSLLRDQRDRAEHELGEERDSHERTVKEFTMKLNQAKFELDKVQVS